MEFLLKKNQLAAASGPNWGFSNRSINNLRDAYFKIPNIILKKHANFFNTRLKNTFDVIFSDGKTFEMLMEGKQKISGKNGSFPKQISTFKDKKILGEYLRDKIFQETKIDIRIPVFKGSASEEKEYVKNNKHLYQKKMITKELFSKTFGGTDINLRFLGEELYEISFS